MIAMLPVLDPVYAHSAAAGLGALLLLGALDKLREPELFRDALDNYRLLPAVAITPFALVLPLLEGLAGALLLPTLSRPLGALLALVLLCIVTAAIVINLGRGRNRIDCGCGGNRHTPLGIGLVVRNTLLMLLALAAAAPLSGRDVVWLDFAAVGFATLFGLGLYFLANAMLSHHSHLLELRNSP